MLEVRHLHNTWGAFSLRNICLQVRRGEYFVILGPCGSGKTLLLETIAGLHSPAEGRVLVNGRDVTRLPPERRRTALVYQQYALFPHLSVRENIAFGLRYRSLGRAERRRRVEEMLDLLGIRDLADRPTPEGLSGGESQKVALARALAVAPEVLLLDEPLVSLDQQARRQVMALLVDLPAAADVPVIHVTHDYTEALSLADRIAVLNGGAVAQIGTAEDLFWRPRTRFVAEFLGAENVLEGACRPADDGWVRVSVKGLSLAAPGPARPGPVSLCIRPEDVALLREAPDGENVFEGRVLEVAERGFGVRVLVKVAGVRLVSLAPRRRFADLDITAGSRVYVHLPPGDVHLIEPEREVAADVGAPD